MISIEYRISRDQRFLKSECDKTHHLTTSPLHQLIEYHRIDLDFLNTNPNSTVETSAPSSFYLNYFTAGTPPGGITFVRSYTTVTYGNIYPGIDLQFRADGERPFEYNFIVRPGADLNSIRIRISGPGRIKQHRDGIECETSIGEIEETIPLCYYLNQNTRVFVKGRFRKIADGMYGFSVDQPVPEGSVLYIDPVPTRRWGTYYGGTGTNQAGTHGLAIDGNGNSIIVGWTTSLNGIATTGAYQEIYDGSTDGFVAKFLPDGTLLWGTYYGGNSVDEGYCCAVDKDNYIFYGGSTYSTDNIATPGAFQTTLQGQPDAVLAKFSPDGILLWGTYYGGASTTAFNGQSVTSCSTDTAGNIYYAGITSSQANIATAGAVQPDFGGGLYDVFLTSFAGDGTRNWGTYYGGTGAEQNQACSVSKAGLVYLSGTTTSPNNIPHPDLLCLSILVFKKHFLPASTSTARGGGELTLAVKARMSVMTVLQIREVEYTWPAPQALQRISAHPGPSSRSFPEQIMLTWKNSTPLVPGSGGRTLDLALPGEPQQMTVALYILPVIAIP